MSKAVLVLNEMPETCHKCGLLQWDDEYDTYYCGTPSGKEAWTEEEFDEIKERPDWCPLKSAPTSHKYDATVGYNSGYNRALKDMGMIDNE